MTAWTEGVSVIVPVQANALAMPAMFESLGHCEILEVLVIDCGKDPETVPIARNHGAHIFRGEGTPAELINRAAEHTRGTALWFIPPTARPQKYSAAYILGIMDEPDYRGGYFPTCLYQGGKRQRWKTWKANLAANFLGHFTLANGPFLDRTIFRRIEGYPAGPTPAADLLHRIKKMTKIAEMPLAIKIDDPA